MPNFLKIILAAVIALAIFAGWLFGYDEPRVRAVKSHNGCPGCDLRATGLWWTKLAGADLKGADLRGATLWWTELRDADLRETNFARANLWWTDLRGAKMPAANI